MSVATAGPDRARVSVAMITYNHEAFIGQAIDSVLSQQTDFPFELVIGEDCSTDSTREIVSGFARRYPDRVRALLPERNLGLQGKNNLVATFNACQGEYIAILEGDDYWTDSTKLQWQSDFLDSHLGYSMVATNFSIVDTQGRLLEREGWWGKKVPELSHLDILRSNAPPIFTTLTRRAALPAAFPTEYFKVLLGDAFLFSLVSRHGPAAYRDVVTGCRRLHATGVWASLDQGAQAQVQLETCAQLQAYFLEPAEQEAIRARAYANTRRLLAWQLARFEIRRLRSTQQRLRSQWPERAVSAWIYALRQMPISLLKASPPGQLARSLYRNLRTGGS